MPIFQHIGTDREAERELYILDIATPDELPDSFTIASEYATVLIVWDATDVSNATISQFARKMIDAGGVYFCVWGPNCELVHDLIDEEWISQGSTPATDPTLMTTWHDDDSLSEAIWFARHVAIPIDAYFDECRSIIAICVSCPSWAAQVQAIFAESARFGDSSL